MDYRNLEVECSARVAEGHAVTYEQHSRSVELALRETHPIRFDCVEGIRLRKSGQYMAMCRVKSSSVQVKLSNAVAVFLMQHMDHVQFYVCFAMDDDGVATDCIMVGRGRRFA